MSRPVDSMKMEPFDCNSCGQCCRRVNVNQITDFLDRGDGICRHFEEFSNLCTIYDERPLVCRVEDYYRTHLIELLSWEDFVQLNREVCDELQKNKSCTS